jgi:hypothetical protein
MAEVSEITGLFRLPITITVQPWFRDHCFAGKVILPAVETLALLAQEVKRFRPDVDVSRMYAAGFAKFLEIGPDEKELEVIVEIHQQGSDFLTVKLITKIQRKAISRVIEHGRVTFSPPQSDLSSQANPTPFALTKSAFKVSAEKIYRELVPFGKAYQNIIGDMYVSEQGAWAKLMAPDLPLSGRDGLSGSPFPLDAAFHAACVWGQRYTGFIPFPVGFSSRTISRFTEPATAYETRVIPLEVKADEITFDLWIHNSKGVLFETVCGIKMRDVSGGRLKPPAWIKIGTEVAL